MLLGARSSFLASRRSPLPPGALYGNAGTGAFSYGGDLPLETLAN